MPKPKNNVKDDNIDEFLDSFAKENEQLPQPTKPTEEKKEAPQLPPTVTAGLEATGVKTIDDIVAYGDDLFKFLKKYVKKHPEFVDLVDKKKLDFFRDTLEHKEFMTEFPIVSRYMICMGQYSPKAFRRFLEKISRVVHPPPAQRAKGYMEDQWVRRQADYVRYLWEESQKKRKAHINNTEANLLWEDTYKTLKGEFDDFRNKYKEIEDKTKEEKKILAGENVQDLLERLASGKQKLSEEDEKILLLNLRPLLWRKRFTVGPVKQINDMVNDKKLKYYDTELIGYGTALDEKEKPAITMIEHLAQPERINEVPQHMLLDAATAAKLPGYGQ